MKSELPVVTSSPHLRSPVTVSALMRDVVIALLPALFAAVVFFGERAMMIVALGVLSAVVAEAGYQRLARRPVTVGDWSAVVTGMLLAFNLPPSAPWWLPVVGSAFAIVVAKQLFGGLGQNFINPALAARAMLMASWPAHMTAWIRPFDAVSTATPLAALVPKTGVAAQLPTYWEMFVGATAGCVGETSALALLVGGGYLLVRRVISWHTPAAFIGTVAVLTWVFGGVDGLFSGDWLRHILAGGLMLGAFFMATDYVTSPVTPKGKLIMGLGCGVLTVIIRLHGGFPEGVSYAILLMNLATPLIDRYVQPRPFGEVRKK